jgi:hypothetical protein
MGVSVRWPCRITAGERDLKDEEKKVPQSGTRVEGDENKRAETTGGKETSTVRLEGASRDGHVTKYRFFGAGNRESD